jgi:hypothetical protein
MGRRVVLLLMVMLLAQPPSNAFDFKGFRERHKTSIGAARGAMTGAKVGSFVGMPWLGAGVGAAVGGVAHIFHRKNKNAQEEPARF